MHNSKLTVLLKSLNKQEAEKFSLFLSTPLFNERETLIRLYQEIKKFYPEFKDEGFAHENLYRKLYKDKKYNDALMRNLASRLYGKLENFLSFLNYEKNPFGQRDGLLMELQNRVDEKLFIKKYDELKRSIEENYPVSHEKYLHAHLLMYLRSSYYFSKRRTPDTETNILQQRENKLIEYFLTDILNIYSMMGNQLNLYPDRIYDFGMLGLVLNYVESHSEILQNNFYINLLLNRLLLNLRQEDKYYFELKKIVNDCKDKISRSEKGNIYISLHNFLQEKMFKGEGKALKERFELYKETFANEGAYDDDKNIYPNVLILAVSNALTLKEFSAAEEFVSKYCSEVREFYRKNTEYYCLALIDYYRKNYDEALKKLTYVYNEDTSFKIHVRTLQLMIYYSMNASDGFYTLADSYKHFLKESLQSKKTSEYFYNIYLNFINYTL